MIRLRPMRDRRQFGRRNTLWHAWAKVAGRERVPCIVRNFSRTGALLEFEGEVPSAQRLRLVIDAFEFEAECYVRHRGRIALGVHFDELEMGTLLRSSDPARVLAALKG